ncbi:MAG TPA: hypothetical protein VGC79_37425 [Polyangiaceae bacterium]
MRAPQLVNDFFEWRWAPCVGLTAGSLTFVALALLVIPTRLGGEPRVGSTLSAFDGPQPQRAIFSSSLTRSATEPESRTADDARSARSLPRSGPHGNDETGVAPRRGFSPIIERPAPPPAPEPPPAPAAAPAVEAPAPASGSVVAAQPEAAAPAQEQREVRGP